MVRTEAWGLFAVVLVVFAVMFSCAPGAGQQPIPLPTAPQGER